MKLHDFDSILEDFINEEETIYEDEKCKITLNTEHVKLETEEEIKISNKKVKAYSNCFIAVIYCLLLTLRRQNMTVFI